MQEKDKLSLKDWILIAGVTVAPMTGFRIWKVGPGEVLCLIYCLLNWRKTILIDTDNIFTRFWVPFLGFSFLGTLWGALRYPAETAPAEMMTWVYLAIISTGLSHSIQDKNGDNIYSIVRAVVIVSTMWYFFLYIYSLTISRFLLGAPLWYANTRYSGGATNPHQIALLLSLSVIVLAVEVLNAKGFIRKTVYGAIMIIAAFLMNETRSSTAIMAAVVAGGVVIVYIIWSRSSQKEALLVLMIIVTMYLLFFRIRDIYQFIYQWIQDDPNGMGRFELFSTFPYAFMKGPLFGLGTGFHAANGHMEFHNSYLEILALSGLAGFTVFAILSIRLFRVCSRSPVSTGIMFVCYMFGMSGFSARRLIYWALIVLAYQLAFTSGNPASDNQILAHDNRYIISR